MSEYKTLSELGVPHWHDETLEWRRSWLSEVKSGELIGKKFRTTRGKEFICEGATKEHILFHNIKMSRKYAKFLLPTRRQYTDKEQKQWIKENYPGSVLVLTRGCQLHGDIDATLTLDGTVYTIPWNY